MDRHGQASHVHSASVGHFTGEYGVIMIQRGYRWAKGSPEPVQVSQLPGWLNCGLLTFPFSSGGIENGGGQREEVTTELDV